MEILPVKASYILKSVNFLAASKLHTVIRAHFRAAS